MINKICADVQSAPTDHHSCHMPLIDSIAFCCSRRFAELKLGIANCTASNRTAGQPALLPPVATNPGCSLDVPVGSRSCNKRMFLVMMLMAGEMAMMGVNATLMTVLQSRLISLQLMSKLIVSCWASWCPSHCYNTGKNACRPDG